MTLIARLQAATGPDRLLDEEVFEAIHGRKRGISTFEQYEPSERLPAYTGSLDDAVTSMADGYCLHAMNKSRVYWHAVTSRIDDGVGFRGASRSLAAAITIAGLRSRGVT